MEEAREIFTGFTLLLSSLWLVRGLMTRLYGFYWYMLWNMLLALVPLFATLMFDWVGTIEGAAALPVAVMVSAGWLLFLPNSYYLLTDLMHLNQEVLVNKKDRNFTPNLNYERGDAWYIFDSFLLFLTVLFGGLSGGFALYRYYEFLQAHYQALSYAVMTFVLLACAIGVHIGRYARWNSWDAFTKPHKVMVDFIRTLRTPKEAKSIAVVVVTIIGFEAMSWLFVAKLLN